MDKLTQKNHNPKANLKQKTELLFVFEYICKEEADNTRKLHCN